MRTRVWRKRTWVVSDKSNWNVTNEFNCLLTTLKFVDLNWATSERKIFLPHRVQCEWTLVILSSSSLLCRKVAVTEFWNVMLLVLELFFLLFLLRLEFIVSRWIQIYVIYIVLVQTELFWPRLVQPVSELLVAVAIMFLSLDQTLQSSLNCLFRVVVLLNHEMLFRISYIASRRH